MQSEEIPTSGPNTVLPFTLPGRIGCGDSHIGNGWNSPVMPDAMSRLVSLEFISLEEQHLLSRIQRLTHIHILDFVERAVSARLLEPDSSPGRCHSLLSGAATTLGHPARPVIRSNAEQPFVAALPEGYEFVPLADDLRASLSASSKRTALAFQLYFESCSPRRDAEPHEHAGRLPSHADDLVASFWPGASKCVPEDKRKWICEAGGVELGQDLESALGVLNALGNALVQQAAADTCYFLRIFGRLLDADQVQLLGCALRDTYLSQYIESPMGSRRFNWAAMCEQESNFLAEHHVQSIDCHAR